VEQQAAFFGWGGGCSSVMPPEGAGGGADLGSLSFMAEMTVSALHESMCEACIAEPSQATVRLGHLSC
jgi:hypothetical protein